MSVSLSPDGHQVAAICSNPATKRMALTVVALAGGESRALEGLKSASGSWTSWTPDGRSILFGQGADAWIIPAPGGQARRIDFGVNEIRDLRVQPGGNRVAFWHNKSARSESQEGVYVMENFLPPPSAKR